MVDRIRRIPHGWLVWCSLWTIYIVWGSTYLAIRVMVDTMPPLLASGVRFTTAGLVFGVVLAARGPASRLRLSVAQLGSALLIGTALLLGGNGLVAVAERDVPSGLAALLIASVPLVVVVLRALARERVPRATLLGVLAGLCGVAILVLPGDRPGGASLGGLLLLIAAATSWATGSFYARRLELPSDPLVSTAAQMLGGGLVMTIVALAVGEGSHLRPGEWSLDSVLAFVYLIVIGSLVAFTAYSWLLQNAPISKVATYAYVNPVIAVFLGWLVLSEQITATVLLGAVVIVGSVAFTVRIERETGRGVRSRRGTGTEGAAVSAPVAVE